MASNKPKKPNSGLMRQLQIVRDRMNGIYQDTYSTDPGRRHELDSITDDISTAVAQIKNRNSADISSISDLYTKIKLQNTVSNTNYMKSVTDFFEDQQLVGQLASAYSDNKWLKALDMEYDGLCKYMPKLEKALDGIKDAVLSADNFDRDVLSFNSGDADPQKISVFSKQMDQIKKKYDFEEKSETWFYHASKYGESIIYRVPYSKAIAALLNRKNNINSPVVNFRESATIDVLNESSYIGNDSLINQCKLANDSMRSASANISLNRNLKVEFDNSGCLSSFITEAETINKLYPVLESMSITEGAVLTEADVSMQQTIPDKLELPEGFDASAADGLVAGNKKQNAEGLKVPGVLLKELDHANTILLYMNDICLGYYYLEFLNGQDSDITTSNSVFKNNNSIYTNASETADKSMQGDAVNNILTFLSNSIVSQIDANFVNANPNLAKEIYSILDYNDIMSNSQLSTIRITYIPPQDITHIKFNTNPKTHRGISDLHNAIVPGKLWAALNIGYAFGILTRGQDKRVYYVKQSVEQNIAQTLLNTIEQIKKNNFNVMQLESLNSILGMTGQFNDYVIPVGMSGDAPINMEVMNGQDIDPKTEFMDRLEEAAINSTGYLIEFLNARMQVDFAAQITAYNNAFARFVFKRQAKCEAFFSEIINVIYRVEYQDESCDIKCVLPTPMALTVNNMSQILNSVTEQANILASMEYSDEDKDVTLKRQIYVKNYVRLKLGGYLKENELELVRDKVRLEMAMQEKQPEEM